jgi:hypothetical protein
MRHAMFANVYHNQARNPYAHPWAHNHVCR